MIETLRVWRRCGNCQTVHFVVITNEEIRENLRGLVQEAFLQMELSDDQYASIQNSIRLSRRGNYAFDYHAPILVVVANRKGYPNAVADSACALQNMMLEAESLGGRLLLDQSAALAG